MRKANMKYLPDITIIVLLLTMVAAVVEGAFVGQAQVAKEENYRVIYVANCPHQ